MAMKPCSPRGEQGFFIKEYMRQRLFIFWILLALLNDGGLNAAHAASALAIFHPESFDMAKVVGNADVLLVADDHPQPEIKNFLAQHLRELRALGFVSLGIEMLPARFQADLDAWDPDARQRIQRHLQEFWAEKGPGIPASIYGLIEEAKREGLLVMAIDTDGLTSADRRLVNPYWVESIERRRHNEGCSRMIVFGGASHFRGGDSGTVLSLLTRQGVRVSVMEFSGLESAESMDREWRIAQTLQRPVPHVLQIARANNQSARHGLFMVSEATRWIVNLEPFSVNVLLTNPQL